MADKTKLEDWDEVAANNLDLNGIPLAENATRPPMVNNWMREDMAQIAKWLGDDTLVAAATTDLGTVPGRYIVITGNTTITAFGTIKAGTIKYLKFSGTPTITYNVTSMILPAAINIAAAVGDSAIVVSEGSGNWRLLDYMRAAGTTLVVPLDTYRNRMVNSGKTVSQENGQTSGTTNGRYLSDQNAMFFVSSAGTFTGVNVQTFSPAGGYRDRITITTADTSLAAGEYLTYTQNLEGSNVRDFKWGAAGANQIVIRFGIKAPAGTYAMALHNNGTTRSYVALFTITAPQANTDTVQTFAVPGDVTGTWLTGDGVIGLTMDIVLAAGTTFQGVAGWQAGNILATSAVSNGMGTAAAVFEFFDAGIRLDVAATGVYGSYEVGYTDAVYRSERYSYRTLPAWRGAVDVSSNANRVGGPHPVKMARSPVSATITGAITITDGVGTVTIISVGTNFSTQDVAEFNFPLNTGVAQGRPAVIVQNGAGSFFVNARLS